MLTRFSGHAGARARLGPMLVALGVAFGVTRSAWAGDPALAEQLFRDGRTLLDEGNAQAACPKLALSYKEDPATGTLLALALCQEQIGHTASAWASYGEVIARSKREGRADRVEGARERQNALEPTLTHLTVRVEPSAAATPGIVVLRDGVPLAQGAWNAAFPIDPGEHVVSASAPGKSEFSARLTLAANATSQIVDVPALRDAPAAVTTTQSEPSEPASERAKAFPLGTIGIVTASAGLVGIGLGTYFGLHAKSLNDASNHDGHCNEQDRCDPYGGANRNDAKSAATASTVSFIAGGVLMASGVALFVLSSTRSAGTSSATIRATPLVGPRDAGIVVLGQF